jgi:OOP family OmpA-OmpF porin
MKRSVFLMLAIVLTASFAHAMLPEELDYVDRAAPDFTWPAVDRDGDGIYDRLDRCNSTPPGCTVNGFGCESDFDGDGVCDGNDRCNDTPPGMRVDVHGCAESQKTRAHPAPTERPTERPIPAKPAPTQPTDEVHRQLLETGSIRLENIYFETGSAKLLPESEETLRKVGTTLEKFKDLRFEIEGHTDSRGSSNYNQKLSQQRAESVRAYLLENFSLEAANYEARGYGESQLETDERNEEERLRNRRVVMRLLNPQDLPRGVEVENVEGKP